LIWQLLERANPKNIGQAREAQETEKTIATASKKDRSAREGRSGRPLYRWPRAARIRRTPRE
jgi:hypothetical protein